MKVSQIKYEVYNNLDIFKFIMAICVIAIHTHPLENISNNIILQIYEEFVRLAVPFFFMASGFLLFNKINLDERDKALYKVRLFARKMLRMYVIWSVIYIPLAMYNYFTTSKGVLSATILYVKDLIFVGSHFYSWQLWYLLSSLYSSLLILLFIKCKIKRCYAFLGIVLFFVLDLFCTWIVKTDIKSVLQNVIKSTIHDGGIFRGLYYIPIGGMISKKKQEIIHYRKIIRICFFLAFIISVFVNNQVISTLSRILFFCVVFSWGG